MSNNTATIDINLRKGVYSVVIIGNDNLYSTKLIVE
ncbi:MAG: hypothetical protein HC906_05055 [Bacteroidales bacterium]|nr:hypothetical protein [Bacteroidales bacterium]